jgi:hypothetical protein
LRLGLHATAFSQASAELLVARSLILRWRELTGSVNAVALQGPQEIIAVQPADKPWLGLEPLPDLEANPSMGKPPLYQLLEKSRSVVYAMRGMERGSRALAEEATAAKGSREDEFAKRFVQIEADRREDRAALQTVLGFLQEERAARKQAEARLEEERAEKAEMMALLKKIAGGLKV